MFNYTIDQKSQITDPYGNTIVDLTTSIFAKSAEAIKDYQVMHITDHFKMRPDLVSNSMYGTDEYTEFILKYSGISNPFTISDEDVLMIPNYTQAEGMMAVNSDEEDTVSSETVAAQIRNYFKFVNQDYKSDSTSYDNLANKSIPSGVIDTTGSTTYLVPYISEDGRTAVTIRNGRLYFGEDAGVTSAASTTSTADGITEAVKQITSQAITDLSDTNCLYNGTSLAEFTRANYNS